MAKGKGRRGKSGGTSNKKGTTSKGSVKKSSVSVKKSSVSVKKSPTVSKTKTSIQKKAPTALGKTTVKRKPYLGALGTQAIKAQQKLSNNYGVTTFSTRGKVSTTPTASSGGFSNISVGIGSYENFDKFANDAIRVAIENEKQARQSGEGITVSQDGALIPSTNASDPYILPDPRTPTRFLDEQASAQAGEPILTNKKTDFGIGGVTDFLQEHGIKIGISVAAFLIIMAVIKKK